MKEVLKQITYDELIIVAEEIVLGYLDGIPEDDITDNDFLNAAVMALCVVFEVTYPELAKVPGMSQANMSFVLNVIQSVYIAMGRADYIFHDTPIPTSETAL